MKHLLYKIKRSIAIILVTTLFATSMPVNSQGGSWLAPAGGTELGEGVKVGNTAAYSGKTLPVANIDFNVDKKARKAVLQNVPDLRGKYSRELEEVMRITRILVSRLERNEWHNYFLHLDPLFMSQVQYNEIPGSWQMGWQIRTNITSDIMIDKTRSIIIQHRGSTHNPVSAKSTNIFDLDEAGRAVPYGSYEAYIDKCDRETLIDLLTIKAGPRIVGYYDPHEVFVEGQDGEKIANGFEKVLLNTIEQFFVFGDRVIPGAVELIRIYNLKLRIYVEINRQCEPVFHVVNVDTRKGTDDVILEGRFEDIRTNGSTAALKIVPAAPIDGSN